MGLVLQNQCAQFATPHLEDKVSVRISLRLCGSELGMWTTCATAQDSFSSQVVWVGDLELQSGNLLCWLDGKSQKGQGGSPVEKDADPG